MDDLRSLPKINTVYFMKKKKQLTFVNYKMKISVRDQFQLAKDK